MSLTTDPNDPRLGHGVDEQPIPQHDVYLVLSEEERAKGYQRPLRTSYIHAVELGGCGAETTMKHAIAETYARNPSPLPDEPLSWRNRGAGREPSADRG